MKLGMPQQVARVVARDEAKRPTVRINFSKRTLDGLEPPRSGDRRWVYDSKVPGLALMVTATGRKTFYLYKKVDGQPQRVRIGDFPTVTINQARSAAGKLIGEIAAGGDPQGRRREKRTEQTLGALFDGWLNQYAKVHLRTWAESERIFKCYLEPWRNRRLSTITRANVSALHAKVGAAGKAPYQANRLLALLRTLWNWHNGDKHTGTNPARGIRRFDEQERERFLAGDELGSFLTALEEEQSENFRDFVKLALFTGARRSNVATMRWADLDLNKAVWVIPADEFKNRKPCTIPLTAPALDVLNRRLSTAGDSPYVLPGAKDGHYAGPQQRPWRRLLKRAGLNDVRIHDLRRTLGSWQAAGGASLAIIGKSLGHRSTAATKIYARLDLAPVRAAVDAAVSAMVATVPKPEGGAK